MKKGFRVYLLIWVILLAVFQVICFVTPNQLGGYTKLDASFWTAWALITVAFVGQLVCAWFAFKADNLRRLFYNMPLLTISYTGLILMLICGAVTVAIPNLPAWVGAVVCLVILGFTAVAVIKAGAAADIVERVDEKVKSQTSFLRDLTVQADSLISQARSPEIKASCQKVCEAIRYSDPMSNPELSVVEARITVKLDELRTAVGSDDPDAVRITSEELISLIEDRNRKVKLLK